ncbi:MAG: AAA family ATPase [Xanthobacteraceae bacterium]|nr:AAA family ATPase [Xanthobacteraceae bacterium]
MADQSDVITALAAKLLEAHEPEGWTTAPIIDCWQLQTPNERNLRVAGIVSGSRKFSDGEPIFTSALRGVDANMRFVVTQNSVYRLGWPARFSLEADAYHIWPSALFVAACANWYIGCSVALNYAGDQTISEPALANLRAAGHDGGDWPARRAACRAIGEELSRAGRKVVAEAWWVLSTDLKVAKDRRIAETFVAAAAQQAYHQYDRALTADEALADNGWRLLASMDDRQVEKLPREGVPIDDPIVAARKVALIAEQVGGKRGRLDPTGSILDDVYVDAGPDPERDSPGTDGVVVLRAVGGVDTNWSGREVKRAVAPILGKRLPLRPTPDIAEARRWLLAQFPHALAQIDVMLSDLVGAPYARFRPTMLVGPPGCGKSRLARIVASAVDLEVHRYDAAGASDNSFGGTARRWSSGEPAVPVLAMIATKTANPMVLIDELDKAATGGNNGRLQDSMLPFLEGETAAHFPDPYIQAPVDCSRLSYIAIANDPLLIPAPLRDRFRILRILAPTAEHLPALCRYIVYDLANEAGMDAAWFPELDDDELWIAEQLWKGGSVRRLREIVARIVVRRADMPRH